MEDRARGKVKPQVDLSEHHEAQMPDTLRAPLGSCQQLSPCEVMAPLRERERSEARATGGKVGRFGQFYQRGGPDVLRKQLL